MLNDDNKITKELVEEKVHKPKAKSKGIYVTSPSGNGHSVKDLNDFLQQRGIKDEEQAQWLGYKITK